MDTYEAIFSRCTIRDFKHSPIKNDTLKKLLNAGLQAPSNDHLRNWEFIVVDDLSVRENLILAIEEMISDTDIEELLKEWKISNELQKQMYFHAIPRQKSMLLSAGALILPLYKQEAPLLKPQSLSSLNGLASIWCCIENILIAAAAEGIFGVTRIPMQNEVDYIKKFMNIPKDYEISCYLALGYPNECIKTIKQYESKIIDKIHFNHW